MSGKAYSGYRRRNKKKPRRPTIMRSKHHLVDSAALGNITSYRFKAEQGDGFLDNTYESLSGFVRLSHGYSAVDIVNEFSFGIPDDDVGRDYWLDLTFMQAPRGLVVGYHPRRGNLVINDLNFLAASIVTNICHVSREAKDVFHEMKRRDEIQYQILRSLLQDTDSNDILLTPSTREFMIYFPKTYNPIIDVNISKKRFVDTIRSMRSRAQGISEAIGARKDQSSDELTGDFNLEKRLREAISDLSIQHGFSYTPRMLGNISHAITRAVRKGRPQRFLTREKGMAKISSLFVKESEAVSNLGISNVRLESSFYSQTGLNALDFLVDD